MKAGISSKCGQAMVEFLIGLVGVMLLLLGLNQIAAIVYQDFITIYSAREEVADHLMTLNPGNGQDSVYDMASLEEEFETAINPGSALSSQLGLYPSDRSNQFDFLWEERNPLQELSSSEKGSSIAISAPILQRITGRGALQINNAVYMPPWEDLMHD